MPFAITPRGFGRPVGARSILEGWPLADGETFHVEDWDHSMVLAEDGASLRVRTEAEIAQLADEKRAEVLRVQAIRDDASRSDLLQRLRTATPSQIDNWVDNNVTTLAAARGLFKTILKVIALNEA